MNIKKQLKKEKAKNKRTIIVSILIMLIVPYIILILNNQGIFSGWEIYFSFSFAAFIDLLLLINIVSVNSDKNFELYIENQRLKIKEGDFSSCLSISIEKVLYVDIYSKSIEDFEALLVIDHGKRNKNLNDFDPESIKSQNHYKNAYNKLKKLYPDKKYYCYVLKKAGSKKYYYMYLIYKNCYNAIFSDAAMECVKRFTDEYNLS